MFDSLKEYFEEYEDTPPEIFAFERLWLVGSALGAVIAIGMYDYSVIVVGPYAAAVINIAILGGGIVLMMFASRRRSNVARWIIAVPLASVIVLYDLSHFMIMMGRFPFAYLTLIELGLLAVALSRLFTSNARAWFANKEAIC